MCAVIFLLAVYYIGYVGVENNSLRQELTTASPYPIRVYNDVIQNDSLNKKETGSFKNKRFVWPDGKKLAVSLCYDDGFKHHFQEIAPLLERYHLKGSFYPIGHTSLVNYATQWRKTAKTGHELGNHSLFHPCIRAQINPAYHLYNYNQSRWKDEMVLANKLMTFIDGKEDRTFAYPCAQQVVGPPNFTSSIYPIASEIFFAARSYANGDINVPANLDYHSLNSYAADLNLRTFDAVLGVIKEAEIISGWTIFSFHKIGTGEDRYIFDRKEHEKIVILLTIFLTLFFANPVTTLR